MMTYFTNKNKKGKKSQKFSEINTKYEEKILQTRRVNKVVAGGKIITFRVLVVVGDKKKRVGIGLGRDEDVSIAAKKAIKNAKKDIINIPITYSYSISQIIFASHASSIVLLKPANLGSGIIAGGAVRAILELGGVRNIITKQLGRKSILNNAKATILALKKLNERVQQAQQLSLRKLKYYYKLLKK